MSADDFTVLRLWPTAGKIDRVEVGSACGFQVLAGEQPFVAVSLSNPAEEQFRGQFGFITDRQKLWPARTKGSIWIEWPNNVDESRPLYLAVWHVPIEVDQSTNVAVTVVVELPLMYFESASDTVPPAYTDALSGHENAPFATVGGSITDGVPRWAQGLSFLGHVFGTGTAKWQLDIQGKHSDAGTFRTVRKLSPSTVTGGYAIDLSGYPVPPVEWRFVVVNNDGANTLTYDLVAATTLGPTASR